MTEPPALHTGFGADLRTVLLNGKRYLKQNDAIQSGTPGLDAELLLMHLLGLNRQALVTQDRRTVAPEEARRYQALLIRRAEGEPVQYLTGHAEFMSLDFAVDRSVLIPRPDTETVVETLIAAARAQKFETVLEIGTGSGCIAVALAYYCPFVRVVAVDISRPALCVAQKNAAAHRVSNRVAFAQSDLFAALPTALHGCFCAVVSNPPYIRTEAIASLSKNVRDYEPRAALDGQSDGLYFYRAISAAAPLFLKDGGLLLYEIGFDQKTAVSQIMTDCGFHSIHRRKDLAGQDRVLSGCKGRMSKC